MKISIITGQTATGKTKRAIELAKEKDGELISADSRQLYKYLDIITGKDLPNGKPQPDTRYHILDTIPIWLYDVADPKEPFSSHDFVKLAKSAITDIIHRGKHPIIVGGSYLYIKHLLYGFDVKGEPDWDLRHSLESSSLVELQEMLRQKAPSMYESLNNSDRHNPHRLIRKIEISKSSNRVATQGKQLSPLFQIDTYTTYLFSDTDHARDVITKRVGERLENGALEEVRGLLQMGYTADDPGMKTIGYKQLLQHLLQDKQYTDAVEEWITAEVQYAKRQKTFMKSDPLTTIITIPEV